MLRRLLLIAASLGLVACTSADARPPSEVLEAGPSSRSTPGAPSTSVTPGPVFGRLESASYGPPGDAATLGKYLAAVVRDANRVWAKAFPASESSWSNVKSHPVPAGPPVTSQCPGGIAGDPDENPLANPAFYCPRDNGVYLSIPWLRDQVWLLHLGQPGKDAQGVPYRAPLRTGGDLGVAIVVAHEVGHSVQHQLGVEELEGADSAKPFELQADCFAGIWAFDRFRSGELDTSRIRAALEASHDAGDEDYASPGHHGTPTERVSAFRTGYRSGDVEACTLDLGDPSPDDAPTDAEASSDAP